MAIELHNGARVVPVAQTVFPRSVIKDRWPTAKFRAMLVAANAGNADALDALDTLRGEHVDVTSPDVVALVTALQDPAIPAAVRLTAQEAAAILATG